MERVEIMIHRAEATHYYPEDVHAEEYYFAAQPSRSAHCVDHMGEKIGLIYSRGETEPCAVVSIAAELAPQICESVSGDHLLFLAGRDRGYTAQEVIWGLPGMDGYDVQVREMEMAA